MKKVLILIYYWPPSGGSSVQRWLKMIKYFKDLKLEPFVITVNPKFASYPVLDSSLENDITPDVHVYKTRSREFYNVYKKITGRKEIPFAGFVNDEKPDFKQVLSRIVRSHFFIPDPRRGWNRFAYKKAVTLIKEHNIDTVITTSPPHSTQLIGLRLKKKFKINWIADLQDPWTDIYYYYLLYHSRLSKFIDECYERNVLVNADHVVTVSKAIKEIFEEKSKKINPSKIHVIPNGYDEEDFYKQPMTNNERFLITYTGTMSNDYKTDAFLKALEKVGKNNRIFFRLVGKIAEEIKEKIRNTTNIEYEFIDYLPHNESVQYLLKSDALLLVIPNLPDNKGILTGKLFEYLGSGKMIIGIGPSDGDAAEIIRRCKSGEMNDYDDVENIEEYIRHVIQLKITNSFFPDAEEIKKYSRRGQAGEIAEIIFRK